LDVVTVSPGNCDLVSISEEERTLSIVAMVLYMCRGGLVWILNVVLLIWILVIALQKAVS
jgi:hypothetical protein